MSLPFRSFRAVSIHRSLLAAFAVCASLSAAPAFAGISVRLDGIPNTFSVSSVQAGFGVSTKGQLAQLACSDLTITKPLDEASVLLAQAVATGQFVPTGTIAFTRAESGEPFTYYIIGMTNIRVTGFAQNSGGDRPDETVSLKAGAISLTYLASADATPQSIPVNCPKD